MTSRDRSRLLPFRVSRASTTAAPSPSKSMLLTATSSGGWRGFPSPYSSAHSPSVKGIASWIAALSGSSSFTTKKLEQNAFCSLAPRPARYRSTAPRTASASSLSPVVPPQPGATVASTAAANKPAQLAKTLRGGHAHCERAWASQATAVVFPTDAPNRSTTSQRVRNEGSIEDAPVWLETHELPEPRRTRTGGRVRHRHAYRFVSSMVQADLDGVCGDAAWRRHPYVDADPGPSYPALLSVPAKSAHK